MQLLCKVFTAALAGLVLAAGALAGGVAHSAFAASAVCGPGMGHTLAENRQARVYSSHGRVLGCIAGGRRTVVLGSAGFCIGQDRIAPVVLSGELAAYGSERCGIDTGSTDVRVRRLSDGRRLAAATASDAPGAESYTTVTSLVLKPSGSVAWIATASSLGTHRSLTQVRRLAAGKDVLLDSGARIDPRSLRLRRSNLTWRDGSSTRSARLP